MSERVEMQLGRERLIIETGKLAKQANGAVTVQYGGTVVLVTAVCSKEISEEKDFFPLTVEYQERTYAAGKIPGGFFRREGRPTEKEILSARLIDRPIRPLFPDGFINEVQIMAMVISSDGANDPDVLAVIGATTALTISDIPFEGPIGCLRIGRVNGEFIINPTYEEADSGELDIVVAGHKKGIVMIEASTKEVSEDLLHQGIEFGRDSIYKIIEMQEELARRCGKQKFEPQLTFVDTELYRKVRELAGSKLADVNRLSKKEERQEAMDLIAQELIEKLATDETGKSASEVRAALDSLESEEVRKLILKGKIRVDGRGYDDIRPISCEVGLLPRTHGSGLFTRGQTQSLTVVTLGTSADEQMIEALEGETFKSFMLHYNFPPFSVGEIKPVRGPGRREIGHGVLAERALKPVMPIKEKFPYTVRVVSDILESNGSSSMATVCSGSLSLMDAGVPIKTAVAGIAMGLVKEGDAAIILTDIGGVEDHYGDMDFKVTGTRQGITALQLDVKCKDGLGSDLIAQTLSKARSARMTILDKMDACINRPRENTSAFAPRIVTIKLPQDKIRDVIGQGGKTIRKIIQDTGTTIDIEDDGTCLVASPDEAAIQKALNIIRSLTEEPEVGKVYTGTVKRIMNFGAFVEILPGKEGLVHVSELADKFVKNVEDVLKIGEQVQVKLIEIDEMGRLNLSKKRV